MAGRIGPSGPEHRICVVLGNLPGDRFCYTMDLSAFKVKKSGNCPRRVKLLDKKLKKDERLVVGETLLGPQHYHDGRDDDIDCAPLFETDCSMASVAAMDESTIYCISYCEKRSHSHGDEPLVLRIRLVEDGDGKVVAEKEKCAPTLYSRLRPQMLALDGKLYVFGGLPQPRGAERDLKGKEKVECPWSEVFDPATGQWEVFTTSSPFRYVENSIYQLFFADIYKSRIVIISPIDISVFVYDAHSSTGWECLFFSPRIDQVRQKPVLVGSTLYWLRREVCALDLETYTYYSGNFPSSELSVVVEDFWESHCRLLHIGGDAEDVFCLVWYEHDLCHFTRVRLSKDLPDVLRFSIISCSSKPVQIAYSIKYALLMDRVVNDASGSASILKRCKKRGDDSMQPLSLKDGAPLKDGASGSGSILKRCKKRSVDSVKPLSPKVDVSSKKTRVCSEKLLQSKEDASDGEVMSTADIEKLLQLKEDASDGEVMSSANILGICVKRVNPKKSSK